MRSTYTRYLIVLGVAAAIWAGAVSAQTSIYVYRDEHGVLNFTNVPSNERGHTLVEVKKYRVRSAPRAAAVNYSPPAKRAALRALVPPAHVDELVRQAAADYQVDKALVRAIIHAESAFDVQAVSRKGASGLMQLMPATAQRFGVSNVFDPAQNISGGVRYMRELLETFNFDLKLALAAYNAGENAVLRHGGVPPYPETVNYVSKVMQLHALYRERG